MRIASIYPSMLCFGHMKKTKRSKSSAVRVPSAALNVVPPPAATAPALPMRPMHRKWIIIAVLVLLLGGLLAANKGLLFAAIVNGKPIFSWELNHTLKSRFGAQTLEGMIGERLVYDEAQRNGISVSQEEIDAKRMEVVASVGGEAQFADLLTFQGMTRADFESQIRLQLMVQKLLGNDIEVTEAEIDTYIAENRAMLTATEPAQLRVEARNVILDQKVNEKIQPWFLELKENADVMRFL